MNSYLNPSFPLPFHRLDVYRVAIELVSFIEALPFERGHCEIRDQLRRASSSCALNIAEGTGKTGADKKRYYLISRGSACEVAAGLDILMAIFAIDASTHSQGQELCQRLYAMLTKISGLGKGIVK